MEKITTEFILDTLTKAVEDKKAQFDSSIWINSALKLNLLMGDDQDAYFLLKQKVAQKTLELRQSTKSATDARLQIEVTDEYREMRKQEAKLKRIEEFVRICKKMADISRGV